MDHADSSLSNASGGFARYLAARTSRRSFLSRVGQGGIAVALGSASGLTLPEAAHADGSCQCGICPSCCSGGFSITCLCLTGQNQCPSGSCIGGCWWERVSLLDCGTSVREWCDCVDGCQSSCNCRSCNGATTVHCCRHKTYSSRSQCGGGCNHIRCRRHRCVSGTFPVSTC